MKRSTLSSKATVPSTAWEKVLRAEEAAGALLNPMVSLQVLAAQHVFLCELLERGYACSDAMVASVHLSSLFSARELEVVPNHFAELSFCRRDEKLSASWSRFPEYPITGWVLNDEMEEAINQWVDDNPMGRAFGLLASYAFDYVTNPLPEEARFGIAEAPANRQLAEESIRESTTN